MQPLWSSKKEKVHSRTIEVTTYACDGQRIIVEGVLRDDWFQESHMVTGEKLPAGVVHHMAIRLLVNCADLLVEDVEVDLKTVPQEACRDTLDCLAPLKGLTIAKGFTSRVKKLAGGNKGCTHLVELILAMAPAVFQGFGAQQSRNPANVTADRARMIVQYLLNTCRTWREDGPYVEMLKKRLPGG